MQDILHSIDFNNNLIETQLHLLDPKTERMTMGDLTNSLNWIYGHIFVFRANLLSQLFHVDEFVSPEYSVYQQGSPLLLPTNNATSIDQLRDNFESVTIVLKARLANGTLGLESKNKVLECLLHEAYHIGQFSTTSIIHRKIENE